MPILPPAIERVHLPFDEVKTNILKHIDRMLERLEKRTEHVENNDKLTDEQREKRLEHLEKREDRAVEIKGKVEAADSFDDLKEVHKEMKPEHKPVPHHPAPHREPNLREKMQELRHEIRELKQK